MHDGYDGAFAKLDDMQNAGQWTELDELFRSVDVTTMDETMVVILLRSTFHAATVERRFKEWRKLVDRARAHYNTVAPGHGDSTFHGLY